MQIDANALQRWIPTGRSTLESCNEAKKAHNRRLLKGIEGRRKSDRSGNSDTSKKPLLGHEEWRDIAAVLWREDRVRNAQGSPGGEDGVARWEKWGEMDLAENGDGWWI